MSNARRAPRAAGGFVSGSRPTSDGASPGAQVPTTLLALGLVATLGLVLPTAFVAIAEGAGALALPFNLFVVDERLPVTFRVHMLASGLALALLPAVILLRRRPRWHRPLGRLAAGAVLAGALSSFPVAVMSDSVLAARLGFLAQGVVWLVLLVAGVVAIRRRDRARHARLMLAMTAVASGAIWVRLTTAVVVAERLPFEPIYGCVAWLGWLLPLALTWWWSAPAARVGHGPTPVWEETSQTHPVL